MAYYLKKKTVQMRYLYIITFLLATLFPVVAQEKQDLPPQLGEAKSKMVLRGTTRDQMMVTKDNMHRKQVQQRRQVAVNRQRAIMKKKIQQHQRRRIMQKQQMQKRRLKQQAIRRNQMRRK
jgi:hypothetical protein